MPSLRNLFHKAQTQPASAINGAPVEHASLQTGPAEAMLTSGTASDRKVSSKSSIGPISTTSSLILREEPHEEQDYKLSSVSPAGEFIPPSPPEKQSFLSRRVMMKKKEPILTRINDDEPFVIPRESFEGYRRSFDIRPSIDGSESSNGLAAFSGSGNGAGRPSRLSLDGVPDSRTAKSSIPRRHSSNASSLLRHDAHTQHDYDTQNGSQVTPSEDENQGLVPPLEAAVEEQFEDVNINDAAEPKKKHFWNRTNIPIPRKERKIDGVNGSELLTLKT